MLALIIAITFITVFAGTLAVWRYVKQPRRAIQARINNYVERISVLEQESSPMVDQKALPGWRAFVRQMSRHFEWSGQSRSLERKLIQAGLPLKGSEFAAICAGVMVGCAVLLFMVSGGQPVMALVGVAVGFLAMMYVLRFKAAKRVRQFNSQLGDALVLAANSLRTGYSFLQSIEMISREMPPPLSLEFARVLKEMNLGLTTEDAMKNLSARVDSDDLGLVVTAVLIQRQVGGNLAEVLDSIASTIRERVKLKGEVRTLTAQGRISGWVIGGLPFVLGLFIFLVSPSYMQVLFTNPTGKIMLAGALVSDIIGLWLVMRIVNIEY